MICPDVRADLPAYLRAELQPPDAARLAEHLHDCPVCQNEAQSLQAVFGLLDRVPAPVTAVDLPRLYERAARRQQRLARTWRRVAGLFAAAAVLAAVVVGLRLEARFEPHQFTLRWNAQPVADPVTLPPTATVAPTPEQVRTLSELIHALAEDVDTRDRRQRQDLAAVRRGLHILQRQSEQRLDTTDRTLAALYATQLTLARKGERP